MRAYEVPDVVDVELKVFAGVLTQRQAFWAMAGFGLFAAVYGLFKPFGTLAGLAAGLVAAAVAAALGFLKWQDEPLDRFLGAYIAYMARPKLWLYMPGLKEDPEETSGRIEIEGRRT